MTLHAFFTGRPAARRALPRHSVTYGVLATLLVTGVAAPQSPPALTLDAVLSSAARQHPLLDVALAQVAAARGSRRTAGTLPNPVLTYWTESAPFPFQAARPELERETQAYATMPLEFLYQRRPAVRGADARINAATADLSRARQTIALDAARAFYRVAAAQVTVDGLLDVRARVTDLIAYNTARVREGKTAEADLIRTQVEEDRVDATLALAGTELTTARAMLIPFLGDPTAVTDSVRVRIDDDSTMRVGTMPSPATSLASLMATARAARPDILAARERVAAADADAAYQRTLSLRQVGATFGSKRTAGITSMIAGFTLPFPLLDRNRGAVEQATAMQRAATAELAWTERRAASDVQAAYATAQALSAQATRLRGSMLSRAEESQRIALAAYQEGAINLLQVLDASRTLADAQQTWYRLLFAERESHLALRAAIGDATLGAPPDDPARSKRADQSGATPATAPSHTRPTGERP